MTAVLRNSDATAGRWPRPERLHALFITDPVEFRPSLSGFLKYWAASRPDEVSLRARVRQLDAELVRGADPLAVHRLHCELLAGAPAEQVREQGLQWVTTRLTARPCFSSLERSVVESPWRAERLCLASDLIDLVATSLARAIGVPDTIATHAVVDGAGRVTGALLEPTIGEWKAASVRRFARRRNLDLARARALCVTAADHQVLGGVVQSQIVEPTG